jgi:hypothetical protein
MKASKLCLQVKVYLAKALEGAPCMVDASFAGALDKVRRRILCLGTMMHVACPLIGHVATVYHRAATTRVTRGGPMLR